jgi:hypothetical protein
MWSLAGLLAGAGGLLYVQERHLPKRLSAEASARINHDFVQADAERSRLAAELAVVGQRRAALQLEKEGLDRELAASRATVQQLQGDLASVVESLPADPRKGLVEIRAARFASKAGLLDFHLVLTRESAGARPLMASVQLRVTGDSSQRGDASVSLKPIALTMGRQQVVRGSLPLPEGFRPRETTVQVLDRGAGQVLGMRILELR